MSNVKATVMFALGLLAFSLAAVEHATAKGGAAADPVTYSYVDLGDTAEVTHKNREEVKAYFDEEGKKGMKFSTFTVYLMNVTVDARTTPPTITRKYGGMAVFSSR